MLLHHNLFAVAQVRPSGSQNREPFASLIWKLGNGQ
jgi:hypothetical protein